MLDVVSESAADPAYRLLDATERGGTRGDGTPGDREPRRMQLELLSRAGAADELSHRSLDPEVVLSRLGLMPQLLDDLSGSWSVRPPGHVPLTSTPGPRAPTRPLDPGGTLRT